MSMDKLLQELVKRRKEIEASTITPIKKGQLTARGRIRYLLDEQSFVEIGAFIQPRNTDYNMMNQSVPADGVITGYGTVDGKLVYVYSQDKTALGGAIGEMHAKKIASIYDIAIKVGAPIIGLLDSAGMRLQEGMDAFEGYGQIFIKQSLASGIIPQIAAVLGDCGGSGAMIPSLSDFVFMKEKDAYLFLNTESTLDKKSINHRNVNENINRESNDDIVDIVKKDDIDILADIRRLIKLLPSNNKEDTLVDATEDDLNRLIPYFNQEVIDVLDGRKAIESILDKGTCFELRKNFGTDIIVALGKLGGQLVGMIANNGKETNGRLSLNGCRKITKFVTFLDAFSIPVATLVDVKGYTATVEETYQGQTKVVADMMSAFISATIPRVSVLTNYGVGSAYVGLNSKHIGCDIVYAWPSAKISVMSGKPAVKIMYAEELENNQMPVKFMKEKIAQYEKEQMSPYNAAKHGYIDDIIEPAATRKRLIATLDMLYTKHMVMPDRKHGSV